MTSRRRKTPSKAKTAGAAAVHATLGASPAPPQRSQRELVRLYGHEDWINDRERDPDLEAYRKSLVKGHKGGSPYNSFAAIARSRAASAEHSKDPEAGQLGAADARADIEMSEVGGNGNDGTEGAWEGEWRIGDIGEVADSEEE